MFERFTDGARRVLVLAEREARLLNHNFIGTEHILLGLIDEGEGVAAGALESLGISLEVVRKKVEGAIGPAGSAQTDAPPFTPRATKVLELSQRQANMLSHNYVGTEHLLLAIVEEGRGVAAQVLVSLGADPSRVRGQVILMLGAFQEMEESLRPGRLRPFPMPARLWQTIQARESAYDRPGQWYRLHTSPGYENKVKSNLEGRISSMNMKERIHEVVIPMEDAVEFEGGREIVVPRKIFPGHLLVRCEMDDDSWSLIRDTPGVAGLVGPMTKPLRLPMVRQRSLLAVGPAVPTSVSKACGRRCRSPRRLRAERPARSRSCTAVPAERSWRSFQETRTPSSLRRSRLLESVAHVGRCGITPEPEPARGTRHESARDHRSFGLPRQSYGPEPPSSAR